MVVSFLEIYCDRVRDLGEAFMSHGDDVHGLRTTSDVHQKMKSVRIGVCPFPEKCSSGYEKSRPNSRPQFA